MKALLALLEQQATAAPGKRRSADREKSRHSAEQALGLLHELAKARGELDRDQICERLGTDAGHRFKRGTNAVTSATKTLKDTGVVAKSRADVLVSERKGRRAGSNGVTHVHVRAEFVKPLRSQARRLAQAQQQTSPKVDVKSPTASQAAAAVPRQRSRAVVACCPLRSTGGSDGTGPAEREPLIPSWQARNGLLPHRDGHRPTGVSARDGTLLSASASRRPPIGGTSGVTESDEPASGADSGRLDR